MDESQVPSGVCTDYQGHYLTRHWSYYESYLKRFTNRPMRVLELGSGLGGFLECCRQKSIEAVGIEYSEAGLKALREKGYHVYKHDLGLPMSIFESESFDAVFSFQVIEHLPRRAQVVSMKESFRVLRAGGQLQVDSPCRYYKLAQDAPTHISLLAPKELRQLAWDAGFRNINMGYNFPQKLADLPDGVVESIWKEFRPDILSQTATILAIKG